MDQWSNFISMMIKHLFGNIAPVHLLELFGHCAMIHKGLSRICNRMKTVIGPRLNNLAIFSIIIVLSIKGNIDFNYA